jgi:hypothetical protein
MASNATDDLDTTLYDQLEQELGFESMNALMLVFDEEAEGKDVSAALQPKRALSEVLKAEAPEEDDEEDGAMPELLPFSKLAGYLIDAWGVPYRAKTKGRKAGKVKLENYFFKHKKKKEVQHMSRYRLTVEGKQRTFYPRYCMRARIYAEQEWKRQDEG